jgi:AbrB family looped-hinge helix DNA binding protein
MIAELKAKSQVTIPKSVVSELGLAQGDLFDVVVEDGNVVFVPVVTYPKAKIAELSQISQKAKKQRRDGSAKIYDNSNDLIAALHEG